MIHDIVKRNRSYRRFDQKVPISLDTLKDLVDLGRLSASSANRQPLKYVLSSDPHRNALIFSCLGWAGYLPDWDGAVEGERPSAYIVMLGDKDLSSNFSVDEGIAAQSIMLGAVGLGFGGCMLSSIKREKLRDALHIPDQYEILLVLALGKPIEEVQVEVVGADGNVKYWRDEKQVHHVPKRALKDVILDI